MTVKMLQTKSDLWQVETETHHTISSLWLIDFDGPVPRQKLAYNMCASQAVWDHYKMVRSDLTYA